VIATETVKINRCQSELDAIETHRAGSAATRWHEDRRLIAEELAVKLPRHPALISRQLQATRHGCLLLIDRWNGLKSTLETGEWTIAQRSHALDLLGIHTDLRAGATILELPDTCHGPALTSDLCAHRSAFINNEVARLHKLVEISLEALDDFDRRMTESGLVLHSDKEIHRLNRYEKYCWKKFLWALAELKMILGQGPNRKPTPVAIAPKLSPVERHVRELTTSTQKLLDCARDLDADSAQIEVATPPISLREIHQAVEPSRPMNNRRSRRALAKKNRRG